MQLRPPESSGLTADAGAARADVLPPARLRSLRRCCAESVALLPGPLANTGAETCVDPARIRFVDSSKYLAQELRICGLSECISGGSDAT